MDPPPRIRIPTRGVVRILALIFGFYIAVRLLWVAHAVIFLIFLGVLFGLPLAQGADWFERRRVPRGLGVAIILTLFFGLLNVGTIGMAPILRTQSRELQQRMPEALDKIDAWLGHRANGLLGMLFTDETATAAGSVAAPVRAAGSGRLPVSDSAATPANVAASTTVATTTVASATGSQTTTVHANDVVVGGNLRHELTRQFSGAEHSFMHMLTSTFAVSGGVMLVLFIAAYIGVDPALYHGGALCLVPGADRARAALTLTSMAG